MSIRFHTNKVTHLHAAQIFDLEAAAVGPHGGLVCGPLPRAAPAAALAAALLLAGVLAPEARAETPP